MLEKTRVCWIWVDDDLWQFTGLATRVANQVEGGCDFRPLYPFAPGQQVEPITATSIVIMIDQLMPIGRGEEVVKWILGALNELDVLPSVKRVVFCSGTAADSDVQAFIKNVFDLYESHGLVPPEVFGLRKPFTVTQLRSVLQ